MALLGDYQKIEDGRLIKNYIDTINSFMAQIESRIDLIVALKTKYPDDKTELDGYISDAQIQLDTLKKKYDAEIGK